MCGSVVLLVASLSYAAGAENVAEGKPAWMSTTRQASQFAGNAVDGVTTAYDETYSVHTKVNEPSAWWKVDLEREVQSALVNIYFRTDYKRHRNGSQLYTSMTYSSDPKEGDLCYTVSGSPDGTDIPDVLNVTCPGTWRYLTIYTETDNDGTGAVLDFAEVQVWACESGVRYGDNCVKYCSSRHCLNMGDACPPDTGACSACQTGWAGADCTVCAAGYYGANCNRLCINTHCTSPLPCGGIQWSCVGGCAPGYHGQYCTQACTSWSYGANCVRRCADRHCRGSTVCDPILGQCVGGCATGYQEPDCTQACENGKYGDDCSEVCSSRHCLYPSSCSPATGACLNAACQTGWTGTDCTANCGTGFYGANCDQSCAARRCKMDSSCDAIEGQCVGGCAAGYQGTDCKQACTSGNYGANCVRRCDVRHCRGSAFCDAIQGQCVGGCAAGYQGTDCTQVCENGKYGDGCSKVCSSRHCLLMSYCPPDTGACSNAGCRTGWTGTDCTEKCGTGFYGANCDQSCAARHCWSTSVCDAIQGQCVSGCAAGYQEPDCRQDERNVFEQISGDDIDNLTLQVVDCPDGYYGTSCSLSCADRHCSSSSCPADGACGAVCEAGWTLSNCSQECPREKYGVSCNSVCGHCADGTTCHHITGTCPGGCQAGWKHPLCQAVCDNGTYGLNCERECGQCNGTCDAVDGRCPWGCTEGYNGSHCSVKLSSLTDSDSAITPVTAGIIGLAAGICLMVVFVGGILFGLVRQGRLQWVTSSQKDEVKVRATSTQVNSTQPSDNYTSISEQASGRNIYDNDYSTLDVEAKSNNDYGVIKNRAYENM